MPLVARHPQDELGPVAGPRKPDVQRAVGGHGEAASQLALHEAPERADLAFALCQGQRGVYHGRPPPPIPMPERDARGGALMRLRPSGGAGRMPCRRPCKAAGGPGRGAGLQAPAAPVPGARRPPARTASRIAARPRPRPKTCALCDPSRDVHIQAYARPRRSLRQQGAAKARMLPEARVCTSRP